jgi:YidC/Oxa1 family membrane protein insertase
VDNRRFFTFLLLGISIFLLLNSMNRQKELSQREAEKRQAEVEAAKLKRTQQLEEKIAQAKADPSYSFPDEAPREHFILGSMSAADGYSLLVFLDNQGAGIERVEIVDRDKKGKLVYRSLQTKQIRGYAGYLGLEPKELIIRTVPKGSPADEAICADDPSLIGIKALDEIVGWAGLEGEITRRKWDDWTDTWKVDQEIELMVKRDGAQLRFKLKLGEMPLDIVRAKDDFRLEQVPGNYPYLSCLTTLASIGKLAIEEGDQTIPGLEETLNGTWQGRYVEYEGGMAVEFVKPLGAFLKLAGEEADLELIKQYRLKKPTRGQSLENIEAWQYHVELVTTIRNRSDKDVKVAIRQDGINGVTLEGWWYPTKISPYFFSAAGARDVVLNDASNKQSLFTNRVIVDHAVKQPMSPDTVLFGSAHSETARTIRYIGIDAQSFTAALLPSPETPDSMKLLSRGHARVLNSVYTDSTKLPYAKHQAVNVGFWVETEPITLAANSEQSWAYHVFTGPKDPELLAAYKMDQVLYYGWDVFGFFAKRLGWILHGFYAVVGNFGLAIVLLTVLVRSFMFPISRKMAINSQKMQSLQPHTAKLKEAFKEDPRKMMTAQQMLFKKAGINQFAGCLPALIQLPIIIGLYRCVSVDIKLRQQPLIPGLEWCSNLAGPDMLFEWHSWAWDIIAGRGTGYFGPYFNILPIITVVLFIVQQKVLMPKAADEQTAIAQKMMMFMTILMGVFFFRVPSGLCIYFITSSTWSLVERALIKRFTPKGTNVELPESTVTDIIATVNKMGTAAAAQRAAPALNKPKEKMTKPPETLAEMFPKWFGKKDEGKTELKGSSDRNGAWESNPPGKRPKPANRKPRPNKPK